MIDDFPNCFLVFCDRIGFISYAVLLIPEADTSETVLAGEALFRVEEIPRMEHIETVEDITDLDSSECFQAP